MSSAAVWRFFRTPKGLLIVVFVLLIAMAAPHEGLGRVLPELLSAIVVAGGIDLFILRKRNGGWEFPSGAVLTGMIVAMLLSPFGSWHAAAASSAIAIVSKYVFRTRFANVFNPAALALVISYYLYGKKFPIKKAVIAAPLALFAFRWMTILRPGSGYADTDWLDLNPIKAFEPMLMNTNGIDVSKTGHIMAAVGRQLDFEWGWTLLNIFFIWVPRQIWPDGARGSLRDMLVRWQTTAGIRSCIAAGAASLVLSPPQESRCLAVRRQRRPDNL